ncbi:MAG: HEAT repeat domain-containing protein [Planctomycetia bacterium]|nr:HEAT repeat domain-containing protein [Planctomycetia bacterium]
MRSAALFFLVAVLHLPQVNAQRFKSDPVEKLRRVLSDDYKALPANITRYGLADAKQMYTRKLQEALDGLDSSLSNTSRALLLLEWNRPKLSPSAREGDFDFEVYSIERPTRTRLLGRFITTVGGSLKTTSAAQQVACCNLIAETLAGSGDPLSDDDLARELKPLGRTLSKLATSPDTVNEVRIAAARALARFFSAVQTAAETWEALLDKSQPEAVRRAAAESVEAMLYATSGVERLTASEPGVTARERTVTKISISRDALAEMVVRLIPVAGLGAKDEFAAVRLPSVRALQEAAQALEESARADAGRLADVVGKQLTESIRDDILYSLKVTKSINEAVKQYIALSETLRLRAFDTQGTVRVEARATIGALGRLRVGLLELESVLGKIKSDLGNQFPSVNDPEKKPEKKSETKTRETEILAFPSGLGLVAADNVLPKPKGVTNGKIKSEFVTEASNLDEMLRELVSRVVGEQRVDDDVRSRRSAAEAIESLGDLGKPLVPILSRMLNDKDLFVRWIAARTLGKLGEDAAPALQNLVTLMEDPDMGVTISALNALGQIGPAASEAVPSLIKRLGTGDAEVRLAAIRALEGIGEASQAALPTLATLFDYNDARIRRESAALVGRFQSKAKPYIDALRKLVDDRDASVRRAASAAILAIGG